MVKNLQCYFKYLRKKLIGYCERDMYSTLFFYLNQSYKQ